MYVYIYMQYVGIYIGYIYIPINKWNRLEMKTSGGFSGAACGRMPQRLV